MYDIDDDHPESCARAVIIEKEDGLCHDRDRHIPRELFDLIGRLLNIEALLSVTLVDSVRPPYQFGNMDNVWETTHFASGTDGYMSGQVLCPLRGARVSSLISPDSSMRLTSP